MSAAHSPSARMMRRETHSPRSLVAIVVAIALILVFAWLATEIVLELIGRPPLLGSPAEILHGTAALTSAPISWVVTGGAVLAAIGIVLVVLGLTPGRRSRHVLASARSVIVVDDEVIASGLARRAASAARISPDNVRVTLARRTVDVRLTPTSGVLVDRSAVLDAVAGELDSYDLEPALRPPRLQVESRGQVGA